MSGQKNGIKKLSGVKRSYSKRRLSVVENLKNKRPRDVWKYFKKSRTSVDKNITVDVFFDYFANLESDIFQTNYVEAEHFCRYHFDKYNDAMDFPFTFSEM